MTLANTLSDTSVAALNAVEGVVVVQPELAEVYHRARRGLERRRDEQKAKARTKGSGLTPWTDEEFAAGRLLLNHLIMGGELDETGVPEDMLHGVRFEATRVCIEHKLEGLPAQSEGWYQKRYYTLVNNFITRPRKAPAVQKTDGERTLTVVK